VIKETPGWKVFSVDARSGKLLQLDFLGDCKDKISVNTSNEASPSDIKYSMSGKYYIELSAFDASNQLDVSGDVITVTSNVAPVIMIAMDAGQCAGFSKDFQFTSDKPVVSYSWSFGDSFSGTTNPIAHTYAVAGTYTLGITVTDQDGCNNSTSTDLKIYDQPVAAFTLPSGTVCTNNEFTFTNTTTDNYDGNLTYAWFVNNGQESITRDLKYTFLSEGDQQIKLKTSIPGCSSELTQTLLNVKTGPVVGFSYVGKCEDETIKFTNESAGSISGFQWNFGNGNTSTLESPSETFADYGNYNVSLLTTGTNGCISTLTKPVNIYSVPQTNFSLDLPPFSCSGSLSQFNDLTPPMADSNIASWAWSFGDQAGGTASQKNPLYSWRLFSFTDYNIQFRVQQFYSKNCHHLPIT
jgi:PKD repeat protein